VTAVEEHDALDTDNSAGDFFDFFNECNAKSDPGFHTLQSVVFMHGDMHDRNFLRAGTYENDRANRGFIIPFPIERKQRLGIQFTDFNDQASFGLNDTRVSKTLERIENTIPHHVLTWVKEQQLFQLGAAMFWDT
jgi:hypothetical protein